VNQRRIVVVGCAGAGKSTLSRELAARLGLPHVERDELGLEGSDEFRANVADAVARDEWIFDGAPYWVEDVVYPRAQLVVALGYRRATVIRRATARALRTGYVFPARWAWEVWAERRREIDELELRGKPELLRLRSPREARRWLEGLEAPVGLANPAR
jgi:adenylate kinase family enzyme